MVYQMVCHMVSYMPYCVQNCIKCYVPCGQCGGLWGRRGCRDEGVDGVEKVVRLRGCEG